MHRWYVLAVMFLVTALNVADRNILSVLLEPIKEEFRASDTAMGFLVGTGFAAVHIVASLILARLADRGVRRSFIAWGLFAWSALTALSGLARSYVQLLAARVGVSAAEGAGSAPAHALLTDYFPVEKRATAMAIFGMGGIAGMAIGFAVGASVAEAYGWRAAFFVLGVPGVLLAALVRWTVREPRRGASEEAIVAAAPDESVRDVLRYLLARRSVVYMVVAASFHAFAGMGTGAFFVAYLIRIHGMSLGEAGRAFVVVGPVLGAIGAVLAGVATDRIAHRDRRWYMWVPAWSSIVALPSSVAFVLWPAGSTFHVGTHTLPVVLLVLVPASLLGGVWNGPTLAMVQTIARPHMRALASALTTGTYNLIGMGLGPLLVGFLSDRWATVAGPDALRYALLVVGLVHVAGSVSNFLAARHLDADLAAARGVSSDA